MSFPESGWGATLTDHDGTQGINPRILIIDLVVAEPDGDARNPVVTEVPVRYERQTSSEYDQVEVHARGDSEFSQLIDVQEVS
ncbi:MAG: hypothetical protein M3400_16410 [Actinomycetota bacterium]|nr:hypothetical protein [Actinomycetota bacterium]